MLDICIDARDRRLPTPLLPLHGIVQMLNKGGNGEIVAMVTFFATNCMSIANVSSKLEQSHKYKQLHSRLWAARPHVSVSNRCIGCNRKNMRMDTNEHQAVYKTCQQGEAPEAPKRACLSQSFSLCLLTRCCVKVLSPAGLPVWKLPMWFARLESPGKYTSVSLLLLSSLPCK